MGLPFVADQALFDPSLTSLFDSSVKSPAGPVVVPRYHRSYEIPRDFSDADALLGGVPDKNSDDKVRTGPIVATRGSGKSETNKLKRKRKQADDNGELEDAYMQKLAREEARENKKRKSQEGSNVPDQYESNASSVPEEEQDQAVSDEEDENEPFEVPEHESAKLPKNEEELDKASRTVFVGNVSTLAISSKQSKKVLLNHFSSFFSSLPEHTPAHKVESIRFRSTAYSTGIPKKGAFAKKELMDATTKSTNAYIVYSTKVAAREAAKRLNGTVVLDRHVRVDEVAHPAKVDHRRCVFVGNLGFVDDESSNQEPEDGEAKKSKKKAPGDVEEGLWRQFGKAGTVESVRVPRDAKTRIGKGFAYVQFTDENAVEAALLFNDKKFPPLLPRKLRVVRAKGVKRNAAKASKGGYTSTSNPKSRFKDPSVQGRANKLLGRAGAALARTESNGDAPKAKGNDKQVKPPESFVFEGHRASSKQGKGTLRLGGSGKKSGGKPRTRSSKRGAAWRAAGGRKPGK